MKSLALAFSIFAASLSFCALFAHSAAATAAAPAPKELLRSGHVDAAIQLLQPLTSQSSNDAEAFNLLCRAHFMLEDWDGAISNCEQAVNRAPQSSQYHLWLGRSYGEKADKAGVFSAIGLAKKVRTSFERAVELDGGSWEARTDLAEFYLEAPGIVGGGKDKARAQAEALMPANPAMGHWVLARIAEKNKDASGAEREYRAAIEASDSGARSWLNLANFYRHAQRLEDMEKALKNLDTCPLDFPEALMDAADILLRSGRDTPMGIRFLRRYLEAPVEAGPAFKAHEILGQLLERQGSRDGAAAEYRVALTLAHTYARAGEDLRRVGR
ncbi:MAG: tetratricopeptide repeat protein [Candidatus Sulfotelmatobacter sp.]